MRRRLECGVESDSEPEQGAQPPLIITKHCRAKAVNRLRDYLGEYCNATITMQINFSAGLKRYMKKFDERSNPPTRRSFARHSQGRCDFPFLYVPGPVYEPSQLLSTTRYGGPSTGSRKFRSNFLLFPFHGLGFLFLPPVFRILDFSPLRKKAKR
jgi:hypothetical protein